jgi:pilus assembly protein CpaE
LGILNIGETLRMLLVSRQEQRREEIGEALVWSANDHRLYWVSQPDLAVRRSQDLLPHVIVVDDDLGGANPVMLISQLSVRHPSTAILALVSAETIGVARQAVLSGARGFIMKPIQPDEFSAALRQVLTPRAAPAGMETFQASDGRIVAFCAPKGGTGRTTLAINTSISLHQQTGEPVALVDADFAAPALDVALNLDPRRNIIDLLPQMARLDTDLVSSVLARHASGVVALLAPPPADLTHPISLPQVQQVLVWLKRMFPWVIVDLGLPLDETTFAFLDGADRIVMSVLPEMVGLRNTRLMLDQLQARGYPIEKVWLVLNRATLRGGVSVADIESRLRVRVYYRIPDDQPLATHSVNRGVPVVVSHSGTALAKAYRGFASELAADLPASAVAEPDRGNVGLFGWLRPRPAPMHA